MRALKTSIPDTITTIDQAKEYLKQLFDNNESYHPDDSADSISWDVELTPEKAAQMDILMNSIYNLPCTGEYSYNCFFDPCAYIMELGEHYKVWDKVNNTYTVDSSNNLECAIDRLQNDTDYNTRAADEFEIHQYQFDLHVNAHEIN